jgi:hypothetical protein
MSTFDEDVIIEEHALVLQDSSGNEVGRFDETATW